MMPGSRLCLLEREEIRAGIAAGDSLSVIARRLERAPSTVCREVAANGGLAAYRAVVAQRRALERAARPKRRLLEADPRLRNRVCELLAKRMAPAPISHMLAAEGFQISAETVYRECYRVDTVLGDDPWRRLVRPRPSRKRRRRIGHRKDTRPLGIIRLVTSLEPGVKSQPGYWEGDLLVGSKSLSACVVLTERVSRLTLLGAISTQTASEVCGLVASMLTALPQHLVRYLCWDQGRELADWKTIQTTTGIQVVFCQPASPTQKPLVENTCGLLRRWLPRNSNLNQPPTQLDEIAQLLNHMPRRSLSWQTSHQAYTRLVATTM